MEMSEKAKEARRQYQKNWAKKHPDKVKEYQNKYWENMAKKAGVEGGE